MYPLHQPTKQQPTQLIKWKKCSYSFAKQQGYFVYSLPSWAIQDHERRYNQTPFKYRIGKWDDDKHQQLLQQGITEKILQGEFHAETIVCAKIPSRNPKRRGMYDFVCDFERNIKGR